MYFNLHRQSQFCDCAIVVITVVSSLEYGLCLIIYNYFRVYLNLSHIGKTYIITVNSH